jgi:hypothetical protein
MADTALARMKSEYTMTYCFFSFLANCQAVLIKDK